jgi:hypothetical protein
MALGRAPSYREINLKSLKNLVESGSTEQN